MGLLYKKYIIYIKQFQSVIIKGIKNELKNGILKNNFGIFASLQKLL